MARPVVGRTGGGSSGAGGAPETYPDTMSVYGATRAESRGQKPDYPYAYKSQAAKAYQKAAMQVNKGPRNGGG